MRTTYANYVDHAWQLVFTAIQTLGLIGSVATRSSGASGMRTTVVNHVNHAWQLVFTAK